MRGRNYTKPFSIFGIILGEIYMLYVVLAPPHKGPPIPINLPMPVETLPVDAAIPISALITRLVVHSVYF